MTELALYNLVDDLREEKNLAAREPEVVRRLQAQIDRARQDLGELDHKGPDVRPVGYVKNPKPQVMASATEH